MTEVVVTGRPRMRNATSWLQDTNVGVRLTVIRRVGQAEARGGWDFLTFDGSDEAAVDALYSDHCADGFERSHRQAEKRARWGPLGKGKLT